jgi:predicted amidohydrolase
VRNSVLVYGPDGARVARYDKIHLFNFTKNEESYDEARTIEPGREVASFEFTSRDGTTLTVGLSVCYDLRFPELYRSIGAARPDPGAGRLHRHHRARALDSRCCGRGRSRTCATCWRRRRAAGTRTGAPPTDTRH